MRTESGGIGSYRPRLQPARRPQQRRPVRQQPVPVPVPAQVRQHRHRHRRQQHYNVYSRM